MNDATHGLFTTALNLCETLKQNGGPVSEQTERTIHDRHLKLCQRAKQNGGPVSETTKGPALNMTAGVVTRRKARSKRSWVKLDDCGGQVTR